MDAGDARTQPQPDVELVRPPWLLIPHLADEAALPIRSGLGFGFPAKVAVEIFSQFGGAGPGRFNKRARSFVNKRTKFTLTASITSACTANRVPL